MNSRIVWCSVLLLLAACASEPPNLNTGDRGSGVSASMAGALQGTGAMGTDPCGTKTEIALAFSDTEAFDENVMSFTRRGHAPVTLKGFYDIDPDQMPQRVKRWLWELKEHGGAVETQTIQEGPPTRNLIIGWLFDAVAGAVSIARQYGGLYTYDAKVVVVERTEADGTTSRRLREIQLVCRNKKVEAPAAPAEAVVPVNPVQ